MELNDRNEEKRRSGERGEPFSTAWGCRCSHLSAWASPPAGVLDPHRLLEGNTTCSLTVWETPKASRTRANASPATPGSAGSGAGPAPDCGGSACVAGPASATGSAAGSGSSAAAALCGSVYLYGCGCIRCRVEKF